MSAVANEYVPQLRAMRETDLEAVMGAFDDGAGLTIPLSFRSRGSYTVRVRVTDNSGHAATGCDVPREVIVVRRFAFTDASPAVREDSPDVSVRIRGRETEHNPRLDRTLR